MGRIRVVFEAETPQELATLARNYVQGLLPHGPEPASEDFPESDPALEPQPEPEPAQPRRGRGRPPKAVPAAVAAATTMPEPEPAPEPEPEPVHEELPPLPVLVEAVTVAVRNKKKEILDLLPDFKAKTGLNYVAYAEDKHRQALFDLTQAAKIPVQAVV